MEEKKWLDAHVGQDSTVVSLRVTDEEKERLERLRGDLRLTSRGQVIRWALDIAERLALLSAAAGTRDFRQAVRDVSDGAAGHQLENLRRNSLAEPDADAGSPGTAAAGGQVVQGEIGAA